MKYLVTTLMISLLYGCTSHPTKSTTVHNYQPCAGNTQLPLEFTDQFEPVEDKQLLNSSIDKPTKGKLCQGQVYQSKADSKVIIYRAWNSTNPDSEKGNWWAFQKPNGKVLQYRSEYEICYQWTPLDKLVSCTLKPGVKVVVGTGQSATFSNYLSYPVSDKKQIYINNASESVSSCSTYDDHFNWE